jgi:hypothetical protein
VILCCNCDGDLYTMPTSTPGTPPGRLMLSWLLRRLSGINVSVIQPLPH